MTKAKQWTSRKPVVIGLAATIMLVGGVGTWSTQVEIAGAVLGSGRIDVDSARQVIQHLTGGVVAEILAENGDVVGAGDVVVRLDGFSLRTQLNTTEGELIETLAKQARLEAEVDERDTLDLPALMIERARVDAVARETIARQERLLEENFAEAGRKAELLRKKIAQVESQITAVDAQIVAMDEQIVLVDGEIRNFEQMLDQQLIKAAHFADLRKDRARLVGEAGKLAANRAELAEKTIELDLQLLALPSERRSAAVEELSKLQPLKIKLMESRADLLSKLEQLEIRSPVAGTIHDSQVTGLRSVVMEGKPIMSVVPSERPAVAVVRIDAGDIEQVHQGQPAVLRFSAFNRRATPLIPGEVVTVSADAFVDQTTRAHYYEARVAFSKADLAAIDSDLLMPGMPVEAFFATEMQTPLTYLTRPLVDYFNRAYRDT